MRQPQPSPGKTEPPNERHRPLTLAPEKFIDSN